MFEHIRIAPTDPILGLAEEFNADPRAGKINLGIGIYQDGNGNTPILATVKKVEALLIEKQTNKSYLSIQGSADYGRAVQALLFGEQASVITEQRVQTVQSPGGTGALRLGAEFIAQQLGKVNVWLSDPTWANHHSIFNAVGLSTPSYRYYDAANQCLDSKAMLESLQQAKAGDVVLFHGCCHNPTGFDPSFSDWQQLAALCNEKGLLPFFDVAYQGFGHGLNEDAAGLRYFAEHCNELLVANSFSKNVGLYCERIGALSIIGNTPEQSLAAASQVKAIARVIYSNPPAHGSAIVTEILTTPALRAQWEQELTEMRERIAHMRHLLVQTLVDCGVKQDFSFITRQLGMFSYSGLTPEQVAKLREEFAVYVLKSGRVNIAGITEKNVAALGRAIARVL